MRKLTLVGIAFIAIGFGTTGAMFYQLAYSGETVMEATIEAAGQKHREMHTGSVELPLRREMNPLAITVSVDDNRAGSTLRILDADGDEVFTQTQNSSMEGDAAAAAWFFAPIEILEDGQHRIECRLGGGVGAELHIRRNAALIPIGFTFAAFALALVGFGCLIVSVMRSSFKRIERAPLEE